MTARSPWRHRQAYTDSLEQIQSNLALYRDTLEAPGYAYQPGNLRVTRPVYVDDSRQQAFDDTKDRYRWFIETQLKVALPPNADQDGEDQGRALDQRPETRDQRLKTRD